MLLIKPHTRDHKFSRLELVRVAGNRNIPKYMYIIFSSVFRTFVLLVAAVVANAIVGIACSTRVHFAFRQPKQADLEAYIIFSITRFWMRVACTMRHWSMFPINICYTRVRTQWNACRQEGLSLFETRYEIWQHLRICANCVMRPKYRFIRISNLTFFKFHSTYTSRHTHTLVTHSHLEFRAHIMFKPAELSRPL